MTGQDAPAEPRLLRPIEVQRLLRCGRTTLHDHETSGRLVATRTLGGHRRYPADQPALQEALTAQEAAQ
jgi:hypothetical protein